VAVAEPQCHSLSHGRGNRASHPRGRASLRQWAAQRQGHPGGTVRRWARRAAGPAEADPTTVTNHTARLTVTPRRLSDWQMITGVRVRRGRNGSRRVAQSPARPRAAGPAWRGCLRVAATVARWYGLTVGPAGRRGGRADHKSYCDSHGHWHAVTPQPHGHRVSRRAGLLSDSDLTGCCQTRNSGVRVASPGPGPGRPGELDLPS
jgi:hypothetical protein